MREKELQKTVSNCLMISKNVVQSIHPFLYSLLITGILSKKGFSMSTVFLRHHPIVVSGEARSGSRPLSEPEVCKGLQEKKEWTAHRGGTAYRLWRPWRGNAITWGRFRWKDQYRICWATKSHNPQFLGKIRAQEHELQQDPGKAYLCSGLLPSLV